jgi:hypothetical protein
MYDESLSLAISKPQFDAEVQRINKIWCVVSTGGGWFSTALLWTARAAAPCGAAVATLALLIPPRMAAL